MLDTMLGTPIRHGFGNQFTVISHEDFKFVSGLILNGAVPIAKDGRGVRLGFQWQASYIARVVINHIH